MSRDPSYFLKKAEYFYQMAESVPDEEYEYILVKKETPITTTKPSVKKCTPKPQIDDTGNFIVPPIKKGFDRYYDPVTKHFYKTII